MRADKLERKWLVVVKLFNEASPRVAASMKTDEISFREREEDGFLAVFVLLNHSMIRGDFREDVENPSASFTLFLPSQIACSEILQTSRISTSGGVSAMTPTKQEGTR